MVVRAARKCWRGRAERLWVWGQPRLHILGPITLSGDKKAGKRKSLELTSIIELWVQWDPDLAGALKCVLTNTHICAHRHTIHIMFLSWPQSFTECCTSCAAHLHVLSRWSACLYAPSRWSECLDAPSTWLECQDAPSRWSTCLYVPSRQLECLYALSRRSAYLYEVHSLWRQVN